eukprot:3589393-Prymnesium_polylepis.1
MREPECQRLSLKTQVLDEYFSRRRCRGRRRWPGGRALAGGTLVGALLGGRKAGGGSAGATLAVVSFVRAVEATLVDAKAANADALLGAETGREVESNFVAVVLAELELANGFEEANR